MPELRGYSGYDAVHALEHLGFMWVRTKGSHAVLRRNERVCIVPLHKELAVGTLRGVLRQAGITPEEFVNAVM